MAKLTVSKRLQDAAIAHRIGKGYEGKCANIHGHTYHFEVKLSSTNLDEFDMVLDFGTIKQLFNTWVQENWDHATLVASRDKTLRAFLVKNKQRHFVFGVGADINTTAEQMALFLYNKFSRLLAMKYSQYIAPDKKGRTVELESVKVWESDDSVAEASKE